MIDCIVSDPVLMVNMDADRAVFLIKFGADRCDLRSLFEMRTCAITSIRDIPTAKCLVSDERYEAVGQCG